MLCYRYSSKMAVKFYEPVLTASQMYTRASASDYDDFQAKGWSTKELLPLMKKHETYQRACHNKYVSAYTVAFSFEPRKSPLTAFRGRSRL